MLRAIAFDLWETLITNTPEISRAQERVRLEGMERILRGAGIDIATDRIEAAHRALWNRCQDLYWSADRDIPCRTQIDHFLEELEVRDQRVPLDELEEVYAGAVVAALPELVPGARELVAELKDRDFALGLISNTGRSPGAALRTVLDRLGVGSYFDAMIFSNEHGVCKPQPSIFEALRQTLGVRFEEMLFVGDNLYVDVHGAQRCGMRAVHFVPPTRGTAVAPPIDHSLEIVPHATIRDLAELRAVIAESASNDVTSLTAKIAGPG